jgi:TonB-dependent starch-binding outer membrane protein SusC
MTKFYLFSRYVTVLLVFVTTMGWSQSRTVSGKVTAADDGSGLPGVNVIEKGTNNGSVTDANGDYSLTVGSNATLVFSFVGYVSQEVSLGNQTTINVSLVSDVTSLSEVVVVGYGTQERKQITSAVTSVKAEDFNRGTVNDPRQLLQGKVPGLNITRPGGDPNAGFNIRLRGVSTFGANAEPLVVIDGVIGGSLSTVDPNDIASIDVLKDASAAAIYGSRGGSGVILVTTKTGKSGRVTADYNGSIALETIANTIPVMSAAEYRQVDGARDLGANTDWLDVVTRNGRASVHNLSLAGGNEQTTYRAAFNFRDVTGIGLKSDFQQVNGRLNLRQKALKDKLTFDINLSATSRESNYGFTESFRYAIIANPTMPVYDNTNDSPTAGERWGGYAERDIFDFFNPLSIAEQNEREGRDTRYLISLRGEYDFSDFVDGLRFAMFYSQQRESDIRAAYNRKTAKFGGRNGLGQASRSIDERYNELFNTTLNYDKTFGDLNLTLLGGYEYQYFFNDGFGLSGGNFVTDAFTFNNMNAALDFRRGLGSVGSYANDNRLISFFGRANFNFQETYFATVSYRNEGSSRFGENLKRGDFFAVSGGVTISNLIDVPAINNLKLRVSYGETGNQPLQSYLSLYRFSRTGSFYYEGNYIDTYGPQFNDNPNLQWEKVSDLDFGADFSLLNDRLSGSIDYYIRTTKELIFPIRVPSPPNLAGTTFANVGEVKNSGIEFAINYKAISGGDFSWTTGFNIGTFSTEVVSLGKGEFTFGANGQFLTANMGSPGQNDTRLVRVKEGEPLGQFFGPIVDGLNENGTPRFRVLNGTKLDDDGNPIYCDCDDDRTVIGNGMPKATVGFNNTFRYKNWDLNVFLRGAFGHEMLNSYRGFYENTEVTTVGNYNVVNTKYYDPAVTKAVFNNTHIEKADFVRLDNASLGYTIRTSGAVNNIRLSLAAQNLFTITGYTGIDPEVRYVDVEDGGAFAPGIERRNTYFTTRTITFGVNFTF